MNADIIILLIVYLILISCVLGLCRLVSMYTKFGMFELPLVVSVVSVMAIFVMFNRDVLTSGDNDGSATAVFVEFARNIGGESLIFAFVWLVIVLTAAACILVLMLVFVVYGSIAMFSKKCKARLVRIESAGKYKNSFAYYAIDSNVYRCAVSGKNKKLVIGKEYNVRFSSLLNKVFDKNSVMTCAVGIFIGIFGIAMFVVPMILLA